MSLKSCIVWVGTPVRGLLGTLLILTALSAPGMGMGNDWPPGGGNSGGNSGGQNGGGGTQTAPEIDPGSMLGGMTLLMGGAMVLADRRRRSRSKAGLD